MKCLLLLWSVCSTLTLYGGDLRSCIRGEEPTVEERETQDAYLLSFRGAYFYPTGSRFQHVYSGGAIWGFELDIKAQKYFYLWTSAQYFHKDGLTTGKHRLTTLTMVPLSFGFKYLYNAHWVQPYVGIGFVGSYLHEPTKDHTLTTVRCNWGLGGVCKAGFLLRFVDQFFFDLYVDYSLGQAHLQDLSSWARHKELVDSADISGLLFGCGLGYGF